MTTILELENLFNDIRINFVKKYAARQNWDIEDVDDEDLLEIYFTLAAKEKCLSKEKGKK